MIKLFKFLKIIPKLKFYLRMPSKKKLIVFDDETYPDFRYLTNDIEHFVLKIRYENVDQIYINPIVLFRTILNFRGNIWTAYLVSIIQLIKPKIVITCTNSSSFKFFEIAKILDKKINFMAIQCAANYDFNRFQHLYNQGITTRDYSKDFYIPNFFCFGNYEIDDYKKKNIFVKNFNPVGSIRLANFLKEKNINNLTDIKNFEYDIYLVSDGIVSQFDKRFAAPGAVKEMGRYIKFIVRYVRENNKKFLCSFKRLNSSKENLELELEFYKKSLDDDDYGYLINNSTINFTKNRHLSYEYMLKSELTISTYSTMLRENLSLGRKTLSINFMDNNIFDFPLNGIFKLNNCSYLELKDRIDKILRLTNFEYLKELENKNNYLMNFDKSNSTIDKIKEKINNCLNK